MVGIIMKLLTTIAVIVLFATMAVMHAFAQRGLFRDAPAYSEDISAVPGLNLTAEQKIEMDTLRESYRRDARPLQERLSDRKAALRLLWMERDPDEAKIATARHEIDVLRRRLREIDGHYRRSLDDLLTPEQREILGSQGRQRRGYGSGPARGMGYGQRMEMKGRR